MRESYKMLADYIWLNVSQVSEINFKTLKIHCKYKLDEHCFPDFVFLNMNGRHSDVCMIMLNQS